MYSIIDLVEIWFLIFSNSMVRIIIICNKIFLKKQINYLSDIKFSFAYEIFYKTFANTNYNISCTTISLKDNFKII